MNLRLAVACFILLTMTSSLARVEVSRGLAQVDGFTLLVVAANCERMPTSFPFQGGDCRPAAAVVIVFADEDGVVLGTCITEVEAPDAVTASCSITIPFGAVVIVSEDVSKLPPGYRPTENSQRWELPDMPPDGVFGGPIFINLPIDITGTTTPESTATTTASVPSSACDPRVAPTPTLNPQLRLEGYVGVYNNAVFFIHWVEQDQELSGSMRFLFWDNFDDGQVSKRTIDFVGYRQGDTVTFWLSDPYGDADTLAATFDEGDLTVYVPDSDGSFGTLDFTRGSLAEYDQAVTILQQQIDQDAACNAEIASTSTAIADEHAAVTTANDRVRTALSNLKGARGWLESDTEELQRVISNFEDDLALMQDNDAAMRDAAAGTPLTCYELDEIEFALDDLRFSHDEIGFDRDDLDYATSLIEDDIATARSEIDKLASAYVTLERAVDANSSSYPTPEYTADEVDDAVAEAEEQIELSETALEYSEADASTIDESADQLESDAETFVAELTCVDDWE